MSIVFTLGRLQGTARTARSRCGEVADLWRSLVHDLLDPYRPERHYMRGPGPKWQAKHCPAVVQRRPRA